MSVLLEIEYRERPRHAAVADSQACPRSFRRKTNRSGAMGASIASFQRSQKHKRRFTFL
jgi:hypothetical protein